MCIGLFINNDELAVSAVAPRDGKSPPPRTPSAVAPYYLYILYIYLYICKTDWIIDQSLLLLYAENVRTILDGE